MRLHQARDPQVEKGKRAGDNDWHVTWNRPLQPPKGRFAAMHKAKHAALPATLDLRLVKVCSTSPGFRTQEFQFITTLRTPAPTALRRSPPSVSSAGRSSSALMTSRRACTCMRSAAKALTWSCASCSCT